MSVEVLRTEEVYGAKFYVFNTVKGPASAGTAPVNLHESLAKLLVEGNQGESHDNGLVVYGPSKPIMGRHTQYLLNFEGNKWACCSGAELPEVLEDQSELGTYSYVRATREELVEAIKEATK